MARRCFLLLLVIAAGAATAVGVAWFGEYRWQVIESQGPWEGRIHIHPRPMLWHNDHPWWYESQSTLVEEVYLSGETYSPGPNRVKQAPPVWVLQTNGSATTNITTVASGWPLRCLRRCIGVGPSFASPQSFEVPRILRRSNVAIDLPAGIIYPGLLANTALFAAVWAALFSVIPVTRRIRRARKKLCLKCGYPRAGLDPAAPCPECGKPAAP